MPKVCIQGRNDAKVKVNTQTLLYSTLSATVVFGRERGVWEHGVWEHGVWEHGVWELVYLTRYIFMHVLPNLSHNPPTHTDLVLRFLLDGLRIPPVATFAAKGVQSVCQKCKEKMAPHFDGVVQVDRYHPLSCSYHLRVASSMIVWLIVLVPYV